MRSWFVIPLILVVLGFGAYLAYQNPAIKTQFMNLVPQSQSEMANQASDTVVIKSFAYGPNKVTVSAGQSVTWINEDTVNHTATSDDGTWDTGLMAKGESKSITFTIPGTYTYHCTVHPGMTGTVVVTQ